MSWRYNQKTGELFHELLFVAQGYSGKDNGRNNPELEAHPDLGPIPCGWWEICGPPADTTEHGPYVLRLEPEPTTQTYGRSGFLMHGDSREHPGEASKGCVIMPPAVRIRVWQSGDRRLQVVSGWIPPDLDGEISV